MDFVLLGCGRISPNHIRALGALGTQARLTAVCDPIVERAQQQAAAYQELAGYAPAVYESSDALFEREKADVAVIAAESGYHAALALQALDCGMHVLVEKPIALSTEDAQAMASSAEKKKLILAVCHQNRFNPAIQYLRSAFEAGRFGTLINGTARVLWSRNKAYYEQAPWRGTWAQDGGTLMNQCIHNVDLLQWMLGGEPANVAAMTRNAIRPIEAEDFGAVLIRFHNEAIGIVEGTACVYPNNLEETLSIFGETGTVVIGGMAVNRIQTWRFADKHPMDEQVAALDGADPDNVYGHGHTLLYRDFVDAIKQGRKPLIHAREGIKAMSLVLAAYQSQLEGQIITMDNLHFSTMECL